MVPSPRSMQDFSPEWLNQVLSKYLPGGVTVSGVDVEPIGDNLGYMGILARLKPQFSGPRPANLPETFVAKLPATDESALETGMALRAYERESLFYSNCADAVPCDPPRHYHSVCDVELRDFAILMEDLTDVRFVNQVDGTRPEDAMLFIEGLADLHGQFWDNDALHRLDWLPDISEFGVAYKPLLESGLPQYKANWIDRHAPEIAEVFDLANERYPEVVTRLSQFPCTLVHCDPRIENVAFEATGGRDRVRLYDWQLVSRGPAAYDVMYFMKHSLDLDVRREIQGDLFDRYLARLSSHGIAYSRHQLEQDIGMATCTIWSFLSMIGNFFFPTEINSKLAEVTLPRFDGMIHDFGGVEWLKSL